MLGIKLADLISLKFWLALNPGPLSDKFQLFLTWFFGGVLVLAVVFRFLVASQKKNLLLVRVWRRFFKLSLTMGLIGFVLLFFFYEGLPVFGARFWFLVWLVVLLIWSVVILVNLLIKLPRERRELAEKKRFEKYLPKTK